VLSGRGLCDGLITRPEESYRMCCVVVCDLETSWMRGPWPTAGDVVPKNKRKYILLETFGIPNVRCYFLCLKYGTKIERWWFGFEPKHVDVKHNWQ